MEIIQKMKGAVAELKCVMKHENATGLEHFEVCFDDGIDPRFDSELDEESCDRTVAAALSQKETLKAQGLTLVTMSKEDWFWHLENVGPHLITSLKMRIFRYYYDLMEVKITRDDCMRNDDMEFDSTRRQFKSFAKEIAIKSCCCLFLACDYQHCFGECDLDYNLPLFIQYVAIVLVIELIIESCNHCDSIEGMRKWVVEEIDAWCDKYFMEYKEYLLGAKRKRAAGLHAEDGLDANDRLAGFTSYMIVMIINLPLLLRPTLMFNTLHFGKPKILRRYRLYLHDRLITSTLTLSIFKTIFFCKSSKGMRVNANR